jgi:hypothetical protein
MIERLPEHLKSRKTGEAIMAPSAIVAAGAGASIAIVAGAPVAAVVGIGALAYALVVGWKLPRRRRRDEPRERIDPRALSEPWSRFVSEALHAQRRFDEVVRTANSGPVRERLAEIGTRVGDAVHECWRVACRGDALVEGLSSLELREVEQQRGEIEDARRQPEANADALDKTAAALDAQLASGKRLAQVATDTRDRLQVLDARLDEAVARAVELSLQASDVSDLSGLGDDVDSLLGDLESLRQGLEEAGRAGALGRPQAGRN